MAQQRQFQLVKTSTENNPAVVSLHQLENLRLTTFHRGVQQRKVAGSYIMQCAPQYR
jgi:hypothetical protein